MLRPSPATPATPATLVGLDPGPARPNTHAGADRCGLKGSNSGGRRFARTGSPPRSSHIGPDRSHPERTLMRTLRTPLAAASILVAAGLGVTLYTQSYQDTQVAPPPYTPATPASPAATETAETRQPTSTAGLLQVEATVPKDSRLIPTWVETWYREDRDLTLTEQVELYFAATRLLDQVAPFNWRNHASLTVRCTDDCPYGVVTLWGDGSIELTLAPQAFAYGDASLRNIAAHELAHVWQFATGRHISTEFEDLGNQLTPSIPGYELEADCLAAWWGYPAEPGVSYWDCPPEWIAIAGAIYQADPLD
jgi:hypothetical protein